jgi:hypothetical protein
MPISTDIEMEVEGKIIIKIRWFSWKLGLDGLF